MGRREEREERRQIFQKVTNIAQTVRENRRGNKEAEEQTDKKKANRERAKREITERKGLKRSKQAENGQSERLQKEKRRSQEKQEAQRQARQSHVHYSSISPLILPARKMGARQAQGQAQHPHRNSIQHPEEEEETISD